MKFWNVANLELNVCKSKIPICISGVDLNKSRAGLRKSTLELEGLQLQFRSGGGVQSALWLQVSGDIASI